MNAHTTWREETFVKPYQTDFESCWKPAAFFQAMQQAATNHAANLGFDYHEMLAADRVWVLSRLKIRFHSFPKLDEAVNIHTWPKGIQQKIFFLRDFTFANAGGELLAEATSAWLLISPTARRIQLPTALPYPLPINEGVHAVDEPLEKINPPDGLEPRLEAQANYSAVDLMGHVNNARYVDWICDSFPVEMYRQQRLAYLQVNYLNEVKPGECVSIQAGPLPDKPNDWQMEGSNLTSGARAFEAALGWRKK